MGTVVRKVPCRNCDTATAIEMDSAAHDQWRNGLLIQKAFPDMPDDQRELLISGICGACWDNLFGDAEAML